MTGTDPARPAPLAAPGTDSPGGLSSSDASRRLRDDGPNLLPRAEGRSGMRIALGVAREPMLLLLTGAAIVYLVLGDLSEAAMLGASVLVVVGLACYQEYRSERALEALRELATPRARVRRDGRALSLPAGEVVVGDILLLLEGDRVPADARLLSSGAGTQPLMVDESLLTGESAPVRRAAGSPGQDQVHAGTLVVGGHALAEVVATGARTAMGRIGASLGAIRSPPTPMQRQIRHAIAVFATLALAVSTLVAALHFKAHGDWLDAALAGITLAMANIPEEFPVMLTVFLALGAWRMARQHTLVRRPPAIEALGSVTILCTDKTGTLTENRMTVAELLAGDARAVLPGGSLPPRLRALLECADAASQDEAIDPMDGALRSALGAAPSAERPQGARRVGEYPLSPALPAVGHAWRAPGPGGTRVYCKGAPEAVAALCGLSPQRRQQALADTAAMARRGLRVLAVAATPAEAAFESLPATLQEARLAWLGLVGFADPLRAGVADAVRDAQSAGVRVIMLTGDHPDTARAIAREAGIAGDAIVPDAAPSAAADTAFPGLLHDANVFARVRPEQKLALVEALRRAGHVVAMTGDGINDAPALVAAHVGIAMGARGTDVAREAASIVLLDDDFVTIVRAIRHGRVIYDNIVRAVRYILSVHVPITGLALLPLLLGEPLVLLPLHVVFLELIIDPASTLVFEREPGAADVMRRPPRDPSRRLLDARLLSASLAQGLIAFSAVAIAYLIGRDAGLPPAQTGALAFIALVSGNLSLIVANRSGGGRKGWWRGSNPMFWWVAGPAGLVLAIITHLPGPARWFGFESPPGPLAIVAVLLAPAFLFLAAWSRRRIARRRRISAGAPEATRRPPDL